MIAGWIVLFTFAGSLAGTWMLRRYALARGILDLPNERSSHAVPTPRLGGVAIVVCFLGAALGLVAAGRIDLSLAITLLGPGAIVALVGAVDDHRSLAASTRLLAHFAAGTLAVLLMDGAPEMRVFGARVQPGALMDILSVLSLVWLANLYNFMDGIDGLAGAEALTTCLGIASLTITPLGPSPEAVLALVLGAAVLGFLMWNFPRAKIFMGDAGSGFLGLTLGVLVLSSCRFEPNTLWAGAILLGVFIVDATVTLLRRLARRQPLWQAHRSHAYQRVSRRLRSHAATTFGVAAVNVGWLYPWAWAAATGLVPGALALASAYAPLVWLAFWLGGGLDDSS